MCNSGMHPLGTAPQWFFVCVVAGWWPQLVGAQVLEFANETATRLVADAALGSSDTEEKDYAWGDVDNDGDVDLVVVRKQPFTTPGKRVNVLLMNEGGLLVDRTAQYASASDVPGDQGFLTPTNDRDVVLTDVDLDCWLDIVTATTLSHGDPKHIGHPRIYHNLGDDGQGQWLGFLFENDRIPAMLTYAGLAGQNPNFGAVASGDLTGDGYPELWFGDYDSSGADGSQEPVGTDFNDKLLLNNGNGYYTDVSTGPGGAFSGTISVPGAGNVPFVVSAFASGAAIADMNGDGANDIIKQTALNAPQYVGIAYNDPFNLGVFGDYEAVNQQLPYGISVGDLNNDDRLDLVIPDEATDHYHLNQGNGADGRANFVSVNFPSVTDGFVGQATLSDLNHDGWQDVIIADINDDIGGCTRIANILRNNVNPPSVTFTADSGGIPQNMLNGVFHSAVFDVNGDGWKDLVLGRCSGTQVWVNQPPFGVEFSYPQNLPGLIPPGQPYVLQAQLTVSGAMIEPGGVVLHSCINGGSCTDEVMSSLGGGMFEAALPVAECLDRVSYYITAELAGGGMIQDPPAGAYSVTAAIGLQNVLEDHFEADVSGWTVVNDVSLSSGSWEAADPNGTFSGVTPVSPEQDASPGEEQVRAFVTENGSAGGASGSNDVDGGPTYLISPVMDLAGGGASVSYSRWLVSLFSTPDVLTVEVSNNGIVWVQVETLAGTGSAWEDASFDVGDYVSPTATVQVRFSTSDMDSSVTEAGIDDFVVQRYLCAAVCPADLNSDGTVDAADLAVLLGAWGMAPGHPAELNDDHFINAADLALLLGAWGACS